jgi:hypothetical protein
MDSWIKDDQIRQRIPEGYELPASFEVFLNAKPPIAVEWNDLDAFCLKQSATKEAVPFLRLSDGGVIAFWFVAQSPAIVHLGSEGELDVIARDFEEFLKAINARCSGLYDFDEASHAFRVPDVMGNPSAEELPALQVKFDIWFKTHTSLQDPLTTAEGEALRLRILQIAREMIRDGCSKVYKLDSPWWSMDFQIERTDTGLVITYRDYGQWYPVDEKYKLAQEVVALLNLVEDRNRKHYTLSASRSGNVSVNRERMLLLVPQKITS